MRKFFCILFISIILISCNKTTKDEVDVSSVSVNLNVQRFDVDFYNTSLKTLAETKKKYPMLFPHNIDSVWINKINSKDEQELFAETQKIYKDFSSQEKKLQALFKRVKYYNPKFKEPTVITMLTNIDYDSRVVYADSLLFISLDVYLGKDHKFYGSYPKYIKQNNTKEHLIVDVANAIINAQMLPNTKRRFIDKMIYEGKKMYLLDTYIPSITDAEKIGYLPIKYEWAQNSEENIWKFFIEENLLYSTDMSLNKRFLDVAPFSKFYIGDDTLSPGQIGVYVGWQIVRSYMRNNAVSLSGLMRTSAEEIFKKSKYKPKR